ncbi:MAG TPA: ABC transporter permease subunit, partial [Armatimonadota bacterium]|nr:ABC transporter permease subunit [Armatimonadota bacterium]
CLPFAAVGIGRSVRSSTRAEAMRSAFRDMLIWPAVGLAIASGGAMGVYMLRSLLNATQTSNQVVFWVCQVISFPAGFVWTDVWDWIGMTPWFWLGVPIALTIHCLRGAWGTAAWLEPTRVAERTQAQRRARADRDAGAAPLPPGVAPPKDARRRARVRRGEKSPWQRHSERIKNPVEVLAIVKKRDAAWHFALFGWILPVLIVGAPIGVDPDLATRRDFFPSFAAMAWIGLMLAYICMVTPTIITAEREGGTLNALRMTNLTAVDIVWGKLKARSTEIGLLLLFGALFVSIFYIWGSLTVTSLVLLWISGVVYVAAYSGFGAVVSLWCKRSTQAILALWALLFVPVMLSLALAMMNHFVSHRVLLPMSPLLVSYRCLVFDMPDPTGVGVYFPARIAYAIWGTSLAVHGAIAIASWWIALRKFDLVLHENRGGS